MKRTEILKQRLSQFFALTLDELKEHKAELDELILKNEAFIASPPENYLGSTQFVQDNLEGHKLLAEIYLRRIEELEKA